MARWMVRLAGHEFDLKEVSDLYTEPECRVARDDDGAYHLISDAFDSMAGGGDVESAGHELLVFVNALTSLRNSGFQPISFNGVYSLNDDGIKVHHILLRAAPMRGLGRLHVELTVLGPDGQPRPSPEPAFAQSRLKLAQRDAKVRTVLSLWHGCTPTDAGLWIYLYKIYEIIGADMAGGNKNNIRQTLEQCGWATKAALASFGEAANNPAVSGDNARHGASWATLPGVTPFSAGQAIAFIRCLMERWLQDKVLQSP